MSQTTPISQFFCLDFTDKDRSHYESVIKNLNRELETRVTESPRKQEKAKRRNRLKEGVRLLKADLVRAQHLVMEANSLGERLGREIHFSVTLRIPASRLGPNRDSESRLLCQSAIKLQR